MLTKLDNKLQIKQNHNYYYQIQDPLNILGFGIRDFIILTGAFLFIEKTKRHSDFSKAMIPSLKEFYFCHQLPEFACPTLESSQNYFNFDNYCYVEFLFLSRDIIGTNIIS